MRERVLTRRELNQATLARQLLLERTALPATAAIRRVGGLQAQVPNPPYIGLWSRLVGFRREELTGALERREVVRVAAMRSTLHLLPADDYLALFPALQPALTRAMRAFFGARASGLDVAALVETARAAAAERPLLQGELKARLLEVAPGRDADALAYAVRAHLPLVQVFPGGTWRSAANHPYALAEAWLGRPVEEDVGPAPLVRAYLAAFGPASVADAQAWTGLTGLKPVFAALRPELAVVRDEAGRELFDLPGVPLSNPATPAPVRFLPEYDNLLVAFADRRRVIADEHKPRVFLSAARVRATVLVDGEVRAVWAVERGTGKAKGTATLTIEPFAPLGEAEAEAVAEGERLLAWMEEPGTALAVRVSRES